MDLPKIIQSIEDFEKEFEQKSKTEAIPELLVAKEEILELKAILVDAQDRGVEISPEAQNKFATLDFMMSSILKML